MKATRQIMGMPVTVEILNSTDKNLLEKVFAYFTAVDARFSTYKNGSEISQINRGELQTNQYSAEMKEVLRLAEQTKRETNGYFDIRTPQGPLDPSGLVKGWAIYNAARILTDAGSNNYSVDAGGDIQVSRPDDDHSPWRAGIQNPFNSQEIVKAVGLRHEGLATSGNYNRGAHIYNPKETEKQTSIVSLSVIGPNIYEADRFATAAFAMDKQGIYFIEKLARFEAYQIDTDGIGTETSGFNKYVIT